MRIILNPTAGNGAGVRLRPAIERVLTSKAAACDVVESRSSGHAASLAQEAMSEGITTIVAAGGDGTVHEVVNGIMTAETSAAGIRLGVIPIGTGNDFVKMVPGLSTFGETMETLFAGRTAPVDVGVVEWSGNREYFMNAMGTGIDVEVVRRLRRGRLMPGGIAYAVALARALAVYRPMPVTLVSNGETITQRIMNLAVCNGPSIGGSFRICPDADVADGLLDTCLIEEMTLARNARMVPRVMSGTHAGHPGVTMLRGQRVHLSLADGGPLPFQVDGELREAENGRTGVQVSIAPQRLNVICRST